MNNEYEKLGPDSAFRFYWMREDAPGSLDYDAGVPVERPDLILAILGLHPNQQRRHASPPVDRDHLIAVLAGVAPLSGLPAWVLKRMSVLLGPLDCESFGGARELLGLARRVRALASPQMGPIELHLPFIDRRDWPSRRVILTQAVLRLDHDRIVPRQLAEPGRPQTEYLARLLSVSAALPQGGAKLRYRFTRCAPAALMNTLLPMGCATPPIEGDAQAEIELEISAAACQAWRLAPTECQTEFPPVAERISTALQLALRRWCAVWWLSDLNRLEIVPVSWAIMAYRSGSVFKRKRRSEYAYDTLSTEWFRPFFRHARKPLAGLLGAVRAELLRRGDKALAEHYYPAHRKQILDRVRRQRRLLHDMVTAEGEIVYDILRYGHELRQADPRYASLAGAKCARQLEKRLRSMLRGFDFSALAPVLLFEAANAVHLAMGGSNALEYTVTVRSQERDAPLLAACA